MKRRKRCVNAPSPTHPERGAAFLCVLSVPLLGGVRRGFMVPVHGKNGAEAFHEPPVWSSGFSRGRLKAGLRTDGTTQTGSWPQCTAPKSWGLSMNRGFVLVVLLVLVLDWVIVSRTRRSTRTSRFIVPMYAKKRKGLSLGNRPTRLHFPRGEQRSLRVLTVPLLGGAWGGFMVCASGRIVWFRFSAATMIRAGARSSGRFTVRNFPASGFQPGANARSIASK